MEAYMNSSPGISMKMCRYNKLAQDRFKPKGMAVGGSLFAAPRPATTMAWILEAEAKTKQKIEQTDIVKEEATIK